MLFNKKIVRPSWAKKNENIREIDLSKNVHFDLKLNLEVKKIIKQNKSILNYGNDYDLYEAICNYYKIDIQNVSIGYGATDILQRLIFSLDVQKLYIATYGFAMIEVYCNMINLDYEIINLDNLKNERYDFDEAALYVANPNGFDGTGRDISKFISKFKYLIADEVYADFDGSYSLLDRKESGIIIIKSLSKSLGIAGLRVGFSHSSKKIAKKIQNLRTSQVSTSISTLVVPKIINKTPEVIQRMNKTKEYLEKNYECKTSIANYVLFKSENKYTKLFGSRKIDSFYRMALVDLKTLKSV